MTLELTTLAMYAGICLIQQNLCALLSVNFAVLNVFDFFAFRCQVFPGRFISQNVLLVLFIAD